jgi:apolipoprotein N-acyltransferase
MMQRFPKSVAFALGLLSATGFAPLDLWPVTVLCLAGMIELTLRSPTRRAALLSGYWFGVGHFTLGLNWIAGSFRFQDSMPVWLGWAAVGMLSFYLAVYPALAAGVAWRHGQNRFARFVLLFAAAWIATEWLRATMFTGFAWNPLGVVLVPPGLASGSTIVGTYGMSAVVVLAAGGVAALLKRQWRIAAIISAPAAALVLPFWAANPAAATGAPLLRVVQPNIGQDEKHAVESEAQLFYKYEELSGNPSKTPRLILWPEAAAPGYIENELWARERVASVLGPRDVLLTGGDALIFDDKDQLTGAHNSVFAVTPDASLPFRYDKAHLVPYGEYLALRWLLEPLGATRLVPGTIDFIPGPGPRSYSVPGLAKVGMQICYEIVFAGQVIDRHNRPDFVFNPSNDAWFGTWGPPQHLAQARLRAIEEGLPVVRATPTGISAIVDARGRIVRSLPLGKAGFIEARLPPPAPPTLFARFGNVLAFAVALALTAIAIALPRRLG